MKKVKVQVSFIYELEIDEANEIVKEYSSLADLVSDCALRNFGSGLPVIADGGVKLIDRDLVELFEIK